MPARRRHGFTYVELVLTVLILGVLGAVAAPRFVASMTHYQIEAAARRLAADLEYARRHARTKGRNQSVVCTPGSHTYTLPGMSDLDHSDRAFVVDLTATEYPATFGTVSLGAGGSGNTIVFDMYGRPDHGGQIVLVVASQQRTITIDAASGAVRITP